MNRTLKNMLILVVLVLLLGGAITAVAMTNRSKSSDSELNSLYTVERGSLVINLTETGTLKSRDQFVVKSEVEGRTSIIYVIDEGAVVKKGELLVELDSSSLQDRLVDQQIQVENKDADYISAKENLEVVKIQTQSNIAKAEQDNQFAIEDKTKYIEGEWPKMLMESQNAVTLAEEDYRRATDEFDWSQKLYDEKYLSETEYRADELAKKRTELQIELAKESLKLLEQFTHTRRIDELDSEISQKKLALERVKRESSSEIVQAEAKLRARKAESDRQKSKLTKLEDQITKTKIYAPADGMVVYATSSEFSWRGDTQPLDEGQEVRERQELIHLPTADSMMVEIRIQESALGKVQIGQPVQIQIDALPESSFSGRVTKIAPLPDATSVFMNPDLKVYDTQIMIDGVHPKLRTGMSTKATILIEQYLDAISVPIQAVVGRGDETLVYVAVGNSFEPRAVVSGLDNNTVVHIVSGLEAGERVLLTPPLSEAPRHGASRPMSSEAKNNRPSKAGSGSTMSSQSTPNQTGDTGRRPMRTGKRP
jgi:HlyD family secretion protein